MYETQSFRTDSPRDDISIFERPRTVLLNDTHWLYIQNRYHLSPRELQVARLVCSGFNNEEIAHSLKIKNGTVKTHLRNIYRRIRVRNKITMLLKFVGEAAKFAVKSQTAPPVPLLDTRKPKSHLPKSL